MSKRKSVGQSNNLFNYFQSPKSSINVKEKLKDSPSEKKPKKETLNSDNEEDVIKMTKKRSRIIIASDSESENESPNKPNSKKKNPKPAKKARVVSDDESESKENKSSRDSLKQFGFENSGGNNSKSVSKDVLNKSTLDVTKENEVFDTHNNWKHNHLEFLQPDKIRDINKNKQNHPDYDSRTVYVPEDFLNNQTPAMRQWWVLKSKHMDSVLFFKVGKFYELYHMDAVVGVQHLGFSYMKGGEFAHSGFPETAYAKMATALIEKGFKVARIEQTENPEMMAERCKQLKKPTKYDRVVKRELCQISSKACCIYSAQLPEAMQPLPCYMYAVAEKKTQNGVRFGVCFMDTSIGVLNVSEFDDDKHCSRLLALCAENPPGLFLIERGRVSKVVSEVFNTYFNEIRKESLASGTQFYSADKTLEILKSGPYFHDKDGNFSWPEIFRTLAADCLPSSDYELALKALGASVWFLKDSELDVQVLSMQKFEYYHPLDFNTKKAKINRDYMILDSITMDNLHLLGGVGSLQKTIDYCVTPFGKRLLQHWICRPLCNVDKIEERQEAVKELSESPNLLRSICDILKRLPDLERQIAKIHTFGNKFCAENHPDSRAIFYEAKTYSKRKIQDLLKTLKGFESVQEFTYLFKDCQSRLLRKLTQRAPKGKFLDLTDALDFFKGAFDQEQAAKEGTIIPRIGVDEDYDEVQSEIKNIQTELDEYLAEQKRFFGCKVTYYGSEKKRFQLDIPESHCKKVNSDYQLEGSKKSGKRYSTEETRSFLQRMLKAEASKSKIIQDLNRSIFEKFSRRYEEWEQVTHCLQFLDVLCSFATYSRVYCHDICLPKIEPFQEKSKIHITEGRHPCITNIDNFVPNDIKMNVDEEAGIIIITGPNMGGKSTLMRQVALITVMAQMGSYVPAQECKFNLVDRIFTRLGAHDNIVGGQSTFFVELSEASSILQHSSNYSLVLLDELGRGTSTHDGNAIATAYVRKLLEINCRTLFSTHYHSLVDHFANRDDIQLGHMACVVENDEDPTEESVTFLYKIAKGSCPKSYGFNAARLAGLKHSIVAKGRELAKLLEQKAKNRDIFKELLMASNVSNIREMLSSLQSLSVS